jgi:hypothetical protein
MAVHPKTLRIRVALVFVGGQMVILHPVPIALHPVGRAVLSDPFGDHHSEDIERRAQRFPDTL